MEKKCVYQQEEKIRMGCDHRNSSRHLLLLRCDFIIILPGDSRGAIPAIILYGIRMCIVAFRETCI